MEDTVQLDLEAEHHDNPGLKEPHGRDSALAHVPDFIVDDSNVVQISI